MMLGNPSHGLCVCVCELFVFVCVCVCFVSNCVCLLVSLFLCLLFLHLEVLQVGKNEKHNQIIVLVALRLSWYVSAREGASEYPLKFTSASVVIYYIRQVCCRKH